MPLASPSPAAMPEDPSPSHSPTAASPGRYGPALAIVTTLFFMWGFLTCLNDILVPHLKSVFTLDYARSALVQTMFFSAYFVVSLPAGKLVSRLGYQRGMVAGLVTAAVGALLFPVAATALSFELFLLALFVLASGITILQVAANPYVSVLGSPSTASARLNLTQAFNSLGTTIAPMFGGLLILAHTGSDKVAEAQAVRGPYIGLGIALLVLASAIFFVRLPVITTAEGEGGSFSEALASPALILGAIGIFVYVGAEVSIGSFLVDHFKDPKIAGLAPQQAASYVSYYWGGAMVGRFIGSAVLTRSDPGLVLSGFAGMAAVLVTTAVLGSGAIGMWSLLAVGLFNSIMFPTIFTLSIAGLGRSTSQGSSVLVQAIVGGAILPYVVGKLADSIGLHTAFAVAIPCYAYIAVFGYLRRRRANANVT